MRQSVTVPMPKNGAGHRDTAQTAEFLLHRLTQRARLKGFTHILYHQTHQVNTQDEHQAYRAQDEMNPHESPCHTKMILTEKE